MARKLAFSQGKTFSVKSGGEMDIESGGKFKLAGVDKTTALSNALSQSVANAIAGTAAGKKVNGGEYTAVTGDATAHTKTIATGVTIAAKSVAIYRGGVNVTGDAAISHSAANLVVADGSTYVLTAGDIISWIVFGT